MKILSIIIASHGNGLTFKGIFIYFINLKFNNDNGFLCAGCSESLSMFIFGYFIEALAKIIHYGLNIYLMIVFVRAILTWVNPDPYNPIVRFVNQVTEPLFYQIRKRLPLIYGGIDFSPLIIIFAIVFLDTFLVQSLFRISLLFK